MIDYTALAEKVKQLILEKKPKDLIVTTYRNEIKIYVDGMLEDIIPVEDDEAKSEVTESKTKSKARDRKRKTK